VEDITALAQAMDHLMGDAQLRSRIGENARAVAEQFSVPRVMASWDSLLSQVP
jgi:glycosyltransferase involved in cell wall biosynthesis